MDNINKISEDSYPLPKSTLDRYITDIFTPIYMGECVTTVWVASAGRRIVNKFLLNNIELFKDTIKKADQYILSYIEPLDLLEESLEGYLRLIGVTYIESCKLSGNGQLVSKEDEDLFSSDKTSYQDLLRRLVELLQKSVDAGKEPVLFLGEFDELEFVDKRFCNNLRSLWNKLDGKLHYVFLVKDTNWIFEKSKLGEDLAENFLQNVLYFPLSDSNSSYLISRFSKKLNHQFSDQEKAILEKVADGHPYFLKVSCVVLAKNGFDDADKAIEALRGNYELRAVAKRILEVQTNEGRAFLDKVVSQKIDKITNEHEKVVSNLGLVKSDKDGYFQPFCLIFKDAILEKQLPASEVDSKTSTSLTLDSERGALMFNGKPIEEKLSPQEYEVLTAFVKDPNVVKTRDDIGNVLWGKDHYDKYSDWAIDQLISKLRKKIVGLGVQKGKLVTLRGRGYKMVN